MRWKQRFACDLIIKHRSRSGPSTCNYILIIVIFPTKMSFFACSNAKTARKHRREKKSALRSRRFPPASVSANGWFKVCVECCLSFIPSVSFQTPIIVFSSGLSLSPRRIPPSARRCKRNFFSDIYRTEADAFRRRRTGDICMREIPLSAINKRKVIECSQLLAPDDQLNPSCSRYVLSS